MLRHCQIIWSLSSTTSVMVDAIAAREAKDLTKYIQEKDLTLANWSGLQVGR
jgi:hypothetical protein